MANTPNEAKGFYKLSWMQRIGFGAGDMAQNLIYQTVSIWLLFFYTNVFGLKPGPAALMFLIVRLVDVLWDPVVGTIVDKGNPKWGKYRSWLIFGGIPLVGLAILCFWNGLSGASDTAKLIYAYVTYVGMSMCYTLVNVPYGALNASLTRDTNEITILTSTRMFMANLGALCVKSLPIIIAIFAPKVLNPETGKMTAVYNTPEAGGAWFITYAIFAVVGLALLVFCFTQCKEKVVMDQKESANVKVSDLWMEFGRNKPLRIVAFFFITAFAMMSVSNAAEPLLTTLFMWLGTIPAFIFMPLVPAIKRKIGKKGMFYLFLGIAIVGMALMYTFVSIPATKTNFVLLCIAQFVKSTGIITATGYMWALVPEVIAYGEYTSGKRIAGIVNALTGIFFKAGMALGGVVPGLVLAWVGFNADAAQQTPLALQGILWLVCVIPAILLLLAIFIISKYELSDEKMDKINQEIEARHLSE